VSKAERGYALADPGFMQPVKAAVSSLAKEMSPVDAFRTIALSCVLHLQRNEAGAIAGHDPEFVHQARVAIRRLRSAFRLFAPVLSPDFVDVYAPRWRTLSSDLGDARDWDVFLDETLAPLEEAFPGDPDLAVLRKKGEAAKFKAQAAAGAALSQAEYNRLVLAFSAALLRRAPPTIAPAKAKSGLRLRKFAKRRLQKRALAVEELAREHGKMNAERRHELRIAFKKLRYALDFFALLFPGKRLTAYQASLSSIQDLLGTLNDQVTAARLIKELHSKSEPQPLTKGWIAGRTQLLLSALNTELRRFLGCRHPWD
jgi:CHAD domain-containing protein